MRSRRATLSEDTAPLLLHRKVTTMLGIIASVVAAIGSFLIGAILLVGGSIIGL